MGGSDGDLITQDLYCDQCGVHISEKAYEYSLNTYYPQDCPRLRFLGCRLPQERHIDKHRTFYIFMAFVKMMNEKLDELGLSGSAHFTNCVGLYDEDHYCSLPHRLPVPAPRPPRKAELCHKAGYRHPNILWVNIMRPTRLCRRERIL